MNKFFFAAFAAFALVFSSLVATAGEPQRGYDILTQGDRRPPAPPREIIGPYPNVSPHIWVPSQRRWVQPTYDSWDNQRYHNHDDGAAIVGAIIGGVLGAIINSQQQAVYGAPPNIPGFQLSSRKEVSRVCKNFRPSESWLPDEGRSVVSPVCVKRINNIQRVMGYQANNGRWYISR